MMRPEQIYQHLLDVAEKVQITVSEENLRRTGIKAKSGLCRVHGKDVYIMDKKATIREKVSLLAGCLARWPLDDIYIVPAVREVIQKYPINDAEGSRPPEPESPDPNTEGDADSGGDAP